MTKRMIALLLTLAAMPAQALEPGGVIMGTLNGQPLNCQIWPMQSDFSGFGSTTSVSLFANHCKGVEGVDMVTLGFERTGETIGTVEIRLRGEGLALYGGTEAGPEMGAETGAMLDLLTFSEDDGFLSLAGNVSAPVGPSGDHGNSIDLDAAQPLEISFSAVIEVLGH